MDMLGKQQDSNMVSSNTSYTTVQHFFSLHVPQSMNPPLIHPNIFVRYQSSEAWQINLTSALSKPATHLQQDVWRKCDQHTTTKTYRRSEDVESYILNCSTLRWTSVVSFTLQLSAPLGKEPPITAGQEARWSPLHLYRGPNTGCLVHSSIFILVYLLRLLA